MQPLARTRRPTGVTLALVAASALLLTACQNAGSASDPNTVAMIPNYQAGGQTSQPQPQGYSRPKDVITVALGESDANTMYIHMSTPVAPEGPVSFVVTNEGTETHEFVVLQTKTAAADFPIVSFEGERGPDRRGRQGCDQRRGDRRHGARHEHDAHPRPRPRPLCGGLQPGRALRERHARGLLGDPERLHPGASDPR